MLQFSRDQASITLQHVADQKEIFFAIAHQENSQRLARWFCRRQTWLLSESGYGSLEAEAVRQEFRLQGRGVHPNGGLARWGAV